MYIKFIENLNAGKFERLGKFQIFIKGNGVSSPKNSQI
jgi:hypothetical protein